MDCLSEARRSYCACKYSEAADNFGKALSELVSTEQMTEQNAALKMIYYQYALSLVRGRQEEMKSTDNSSPDEEDKSDEDEDSEENGDGNGMDVAVAGSSKDTPTVTKSDEENEDDLDLAWNVLEISRIEFEKRPSTHSVQLIEVLSLEAELVALHCSYGEAIDQLDLALKVIADHEKPLKVLELKVLLQKAVYQIKLLSFTGAVCALERALGVAESITGAKDYVTMVQMMKSGIEAAVEETDPDMQEKSLKTLATQMLISAELDIAVAFLPFGSLAAIETAQQNEEAQGKPATVQTRNISHLVRRKSNTNATTIATKPKEATGEKQALKRGSEENKDSAEKDEPSEVKKMKIKDE